MSPLWIIAAISAFFIQGLCGFANTLVFTSILGFGENNVNISPVELLLGCPANIIMTWKHRKHLKASIYVPLSLCVLAGSAPGAFLLKNINAQYTKIAFGVVIIFVGIEMLLREKGHNLFGDSKIVFGIISFLSGILCGLFGVGALLAALVSRMTKDSTEFKANINVIFFVENTFRIILYSIIGVITLDSLKQAALVVPFVLIGLFAGLFSSRFVKESIVKILVIILLVLSGVILILNNLG